MVTKLRAAYRSLGDTFTVVRSFRALAGRYVFGDLASGNVWALAEDAQGNRQMTLVLKHNLIVSSFGRDSAGELYLVDYGNGAVLRVALAP